MKSWLPMICALPLFMAPALAEEVDGRVGWSRLTEMGLGVSGRIHEVVARAGEVVAADSLILRLEPAPFERAVAEAEAAVAAARLHLAEAQREMERAQELYDRTVLSDHELQLAQIGEADARLAMKRAEREWAQAGRALSLSQIRAPFRAHLLAVRARPGQTVAVALENPVLVRLAHAGEREVRARLSRGQALRLKPGQTVTVKATKSYQGTITALSHDSEQGYELVVVVDGSELLVGDSAKLVLP